MCCLRGMDTIKRNPKSGAPPRRILGEKGKIGGKNPYKNISKYAKTAVLLRFCVVSKIEYKYGAPNWARTSDPLINSQML